MTRHHAVPEHAHGFESSLITSGIADADETADGREVGEQTDMLTRARAGHRQAPVQTSTGPETGPATDRKPSE